MPCLICGNPKTVRSHLVPRSLAHEVRGKDKTLSLLSRTPGRPQSMQAGPFDRDLLCDQHEKVTAELDTCGMKFIRKARQLVRSSPGVQFVDVPNPTPAKLSRFVGSIVWRCFLSPQGENDPTALAEHRSTLERWVFENVSSDNLTAVAAATSYRVGSLKGRLIVLPWRVAVPDRCIWHMELGGMSFLMEAGIHSKFKSIAPARLELSDPVMVYINDETDALAWQPTADIFRAVHSRNATRQR